MLSFRLFTLCGCKAFISVDSQNVQSLARFGNLCSAIKRLPASVLLPTGLAKHGDFPVASGGLANTWRGEYRGVRVAIKAFRTYSTQNLEVAKEVRIQRI